MPSSTACSGRCGVVSTLRVLRASPRVQHDIRESAADIDGKPHLGSLKHSEILHADRQTVAKIAAIFIPAAAPMVERVAPMR